MTKTLRNLTLMKSRLAFFASAPATRSQLLEAARLAVAYEIADFFTFLVKSWAESPYTTVTEARSVNCHRQLSAPPTQTTSTISETARECVVGG